MNVKIKGVHVRLTESLKAYVEKHLVQPIRRLRLGDSTSLSVQLVDDNGPHKGGEDKEVRVTVHLPEKATLHVAERGADLLSCVCLARDRIDEAARRTLAKRASKRWRAELRTM